MDYHTLENNMNDKGLPASGGDRPLFMLISLGCDKNLVDSEMMMGKLAKAGYRLTEDETEAEVIVVNTCCFIMDAKEESINTLIECGALKEKGKLKCLIAAGCLAQRYADEINKELPEVDAVIGTTAFDKISDCADRVLGRGQYASDNKAFIKETEALNRLVSGLPRFHTGNPCTGYLKIAEGCDKNCTYCIIPKIRGSYRSVPMETLIKEATDLADTGVRELILVAQETTVYGTDIYGRKALPELLKKLEELPFEWIRIMYCYPEEIDEELIETMAQSKKICHYLDLPVQHSSNKILKRMNRRTDRKDLLKVIEMLKERIPDMVLRTTLITGFPGETNEDFEDLCDFVRTVRFDRLGVFTFSPEEGTAAEAMDGQVSEEIKSARRDAVMEIQQEIAFEKALEKKGKELSCMVIGRLPEDNVLVCRSYMDAPDVDGYVFVDTDIDPVSGTMVDVRVTGARGYDLTGEIITGLS